MTMLYEIYDISPQLRTWSPIQAFEAPAVSVYNIVGPGANSRTWAKKRPFFWAYWGAHLPDKPQEAS
jgi:hypothetical protein